MDIKKLWNEKRWLFFLLLPVVAWVAFLRFYEMWQVTQAEKSIKKGMKKEAKLLNKINNNRDKIAAKQEAVNQIKKKIAERRPEDVPLDWHKNF